MANLRKNWLVLRGKTIRLMRLTWYPSVAPSSWKLKHWLSQWGFDNNQCNFASITRIIASSSSKAVFKLRLIHSSILLSHSSLSFCILCFRFSLNYWVPIFCCFIIQSGVVFWIHVDQISHANGASSALVAQSCLQSFGFVFNNGGFVDYRNTFQFLKQFPKFDLEALVVWLGPATTQQARRVLPSVLLHLD